MPIVDYDGGDWSVVIDIDSVPLSHNGAIPRSRRVRL